MISFLEAEADAEGEDAGGEEVDSVGVFEAGEAAHLDEAPPWILTKSHTQDGGLEGYTISGTITGHVEFGTSVDDQTSADG